MISSNRARRIVARVAAVALLVSGSTLIATSVAHAAVNCDSVFEGQTPADPIKKEADKTQAYAGQEVTFTLTFTATGTADNVTADCYRVDDGSNATLNALVTGLNAEKTQANTGKDEVQHVTYTITIPDGLAGHKLVDRAKATSGSVESRSDLVSIDIVEPPCTENCPSPTPTPTVTETPGPSVTPVVSPTTSVKGVTLGATGSSTRSMLVLGIFLFLGGLVLSGVSIRRRLQR